MGEGQTPAFATIGGRTCAVFMGNRSLIALSVADGKVVWRFECTHQHSRGTTIPTPLVLDRMIVNVPDLDTVHAVSFDPAEARAGRGVRVEVGPLHVHVDPPVQSAGRIPVWIRGRDPGGERGRREQVGRQAGLRRRGDGKAKWTEPGFQSGVAITEADGLLFVRSYQTLRLVEATPDGYRKRGEIKVHDCRIPTVNLVDLVMPVVSGGRPVHPDAGTKLICYKMTK
jgi:hypothetical protein